jgi:hypothetical protein
MQKSDTLFLKRHDQMPNNSCLRAASSMSVRIIWSLRYIADWVAARFAELSAG